MDCYSVGAVPKVKDLLLLTSALGRSFENGSSEI